MAKKYMYKYIGAGLMGLFLFMMFPSGIQTDTQEGLQMYGSATLDYQDESGNSMFTQTVHNQLFDAGETEILEQVFANGGMVATIDNVQIRSMCVANGTPLVNTYEAATAAHFEGNSTLSGLPNCIEADFTITTSETAVSPPNIFTAGTHVAADSQITSIGICSGTASAGTHLGCSGVLFAVVDTSDVTLAGTESVTITYTFDISSEGD